jgi:hypothetical protein
VAESSHSWLSRSPRLALLEEYDLPRCRTCSDAKHPDNAVVSFGAGDWGSGVAWHRHGPGFSEVANNKLELELNLSR